MEDVDAELESKVAALREVDEKIKKVFQSSEDSRYVCHSE
jgi:hypothetical protein